MTPEEEFNAKYPVHAELKRREEERDTIQSFLDFILDDQDIRFAQYSDMDDDDNELYPVYMGDSAREALIGKFMGIDPRAFHDEKDAMYNEYVKVNDCE